MMSVLHTFFCVAYLFYFLISSVHGKIEIVRSIKASIMHVLDCRFHPFFVKAPYVGAAFVGGNVGNHNPEFLAYIVLLCALAIFCPYIFPFFFYLHLV